VHPDEIVDSLHALFIDDRLVSAHVSADRVRKVVNARRFAGRSTRQDSAGTVHCDRTRYEPVTTVVADADTYRLDILDTSGAVFVSSTVDRTEAQRLADHRSRENAAKDADGTITVTGAATNMGPRTHVLTPAGGSAPEPDAVGTLPEYAQHAAVTQALEILRADGVGVATIPGRKMLLRDWHGPQGPQGAFIVPGAGRTLEVTWFIDGAQDERSARSRRSRTVRALRNTALDGAAAAFHSSGWTVWRVESNNTATRRALRVDVTPPAASS
jgi:hypothetical protein